MGPGLGLWEGLSSCAEGTGTLPRLEDRTWKEGEPGRLLDWKLQSIAQKREKDAVNLGARVGKQA